MKLINKYSVLTLSILVNGLFTNASYANNILTNNEMELFQGNNITISNVLSNDKTEVSIEGNTLVNLLDLRLNDREPTLSNPSFIDIENNEWGYDWSVGQAYNNWIEIGNNLNMIKPNKTYTVVMNIKENNPMFNGAKVDRESSMHIWAPGCKSYTFGIPSGKTGVYVHTFTTVEDSTRTQNQIGWLINSKASDWNTIELNGGRLVFSDVMILEGDWSNKDLPKYFKGMKSVGENEDSNHKIDIISNNKNFLDLGSDKNGNVKGIGVDIKRNEGKISLSGNSNDYVTFDLSTLEYIGGYVPYSTVWHKDKTLINSPGTYTISYKMRIPIELTQMIGNLISINVIYDDNKQKHKEHWIGQINTEYIQEVSFTIDVSKKINGISICRWYGGNSDGITIEDFQIEKSDNKSEFSPNSSDILEVPLNEPLRGISGYSSDRFVKKDNKWYIERNFKEVILDGSESWVWRTGYDNLNTDLITCHLVDSGVFGNSEMYLIDKFNYLGKVDSPENSVSEEGLSRYNGFAHLYFTVKRSRLVTQDINGFKEWLSKNPVKVIYKLNNPEYEEIISPLIGIHLGTTHIYNNSVIPAKMTVSIDRAFNKVKEIVDLAKSNPTIENISLARIWVNSLKESVYKDMFQNEINNITKVEGIDMQRQTATANLDVYIKSENMLSLSLDTNSVTFDGYSGVEPIEKLGAVNITVNSSLPYSLNAYMPTEIANSDKSETMPIDILNIRENTETEYQTFTNNTDKIVLKGDCISGNDNIHTIDIKLDSNEAYTRDIYKTVIKFEAEQK